MGIDISKPFPQTIEEGGKVTHIHRFLPNDLHERDLQDALEALMPIANAAQKPPQWIFLRACQRDKGDPLGQAGYIGLTVES
jgi:hypothetical protein